MVGRLGVEGFVGWRPCALVAVGGLVSSAKSALSEPTKRSPGTPGVVNLGSEFHVFVRGTDQRLYETYFRPTTGWSAGHVKDGTAVAIA